MLRACCYCTRTVCYGCGILQCVLQSWPSHRRSCCQTVLMLTRGLRDLWVPLAVSRASRLSLWLWLRLPSLPVCLCHFISLCLSAALLPVYLLILRLAFPVYSVEISCSLPPQCWDCRPVPTHLTPSLLLRLYFPGWRGSSEVMSTGCSCRGPRVQVSAPTWQLRTLCNFSSRAI